MNALERRWIFALVGVLGLNLAAYLAFTLPRTLQQRDIASRGKILQSEIELERKRVAGVRETHDAIEANARDEARFFKEIVGSRRPGLVSSLRTIEELASAQGLKVGQQAFSQDDVKGIPLERFRVRMPVEGSYRQLVSFLHGLERSSQFLTLDEITVSTDLERGEQAKLNLLLSCYFRLAEESQL
jgi:Tfp pilus assembly protein PilO